MDLWRQFPCERWSSRATDTCWSFKLVHCGHHLVTAQTREDVPVSAEGAGLLMGRERSAVWGRAPVSGGAPTPDGVLRASASFSHMGAQVLAHTSLSFPHPEIYVLTLTIGHCFQKQYCDVIQHQTLCRNALRQHWPTQIKPAWWSFSLSCRTQSSPARRALRLLLAFGVSFSAWYQQGKVMGKQCGICADRSVPLVHGIPSDSERFLLCTCFRSKRAEENRSWSAKAKAWGKQAECKKARKIITIAFYKFLLSVR